MIDDTLIDGLSRALSVEDGAEDPIWGALAEGRITAGEAARTAEVAGEDAARLAALFAPLDDAALARIDKAVDAPDRDGALLDGLAEVLAEAAAGEGALESEADDARLAALLAPLEAGALGRLDAIAEGAESEAGAQPARAAVEPEAPQTSAGEPEAGARILRFPARRVWPAVGLGLALAAGLALLALRPDGVTLPAYTVELTGGDQVVRSDPTAAARPAFRRDSTIDLILRPAQAIQARPSASVELRGASGDHPVALPVEVSPAGVVSYVGPAAPLFAAPPGDYSLRITLEADGAVRVVEQPIRIVAEAP